jgi:uncharacterized protein with HEPN domain
MVELLPRDLSLLLDIVIAARDARSFVVGLDEPAFLASRLHQNAVIRSLEVIGEAANMLAPECRAALPNNIPWREIIGLRHRLIHGYAEVQLDRVWAIVQNDLAPLIAALEPLIPPDEPAAP